MSSSSNEGTHNFPWKPEPSRLDFRERVRQPSNHLTVRKMVKNFAEVKSQTHLRLCFEEDVTNTVEKEQKMDVDDTIEQSGCTNKKNESNSRKMKISTHLHVGSEEEIENHTFEDQNKGNSLGKVEYKHDQNQDMNDIERNSSIESNDHYTELKSVRKMVAIQKIFSSKPIKRRRLEEDTIDSSKPIKRRHLEEDTIEQAEIPTATVDHKKTYVHKIKRSLFTKQNTQNEKLISESVDNVKLNSTSSENFNRSLENEVQKNDLSNNHLKLGDKTQENINDCIENETVDKSMNAVAQISKNSNSETLNDHCASTNTKVCYIDHKQTQTTTEPTEHITKPYSRTKKKNDKPRLLLRLRSNPDKKTYSVVKTTIKEHRKAHKNEEEESCCKNVSHDDVTESTANTSQRTTLQKLNMINQIPLPDNDKCSKTYKNPIVVLKDCAKLETTKSYFLAQPKKLSGCFEPLLQNNLKTNYLNDTTTPNHVDSSLCESGVIKGTIVNKIPTGDKMPHQSKKKKLRNYIPVSKINKPKCSTKKYLNKNLGLLLNNETPIDLLVTTKDNRGRTDLRSKPVNKYGNVKQHIVLGRKFSPRISLVKENTCQTRNSINDKEQLPGQRLSLKVSILLSKLNNNWLQPGQQPSLNQTTPSQTSCNEINITSDVKSKSGTNLDIDKSFLKQNYSTSVTRETDQFNNNQLINKSRNILCQNLSQRGTAKSGSKVNNDEKEKHLTVSQNQKTTKIAKIVISKFEKEIIGQLNLYLLQSKSRFQETNLQLKLISGRNAKPKMPLKNRTINRCKANSIKKSYCKRPYQSRTVRFLLDMSTKYGELRREMNELKSVLGSEKEGMKTIPSNEKVDFKRNSIKTEIAYSYNKIVHQENTEAYDSNKVVDQENTEAYDSNKVVDQENTEAYDSNKIVDQENAEADDSNKVVDQENAEAYDSNKKVDQENTEAYDSNKVVHVENTEAYDSNKVVDQENNEAYDANKVVDLENTEAYGSNKIVDQENTEAYDSNKIVDQENTEAYDSKKVVDQENIEAYDANKIVDLENTEAYGSNKIVDQENTEAYDSNKIFDQENTEAYDSTKVVDQQNTEAYDAIKIVDLENTKAYGSNKIIDLENTEAYDSNKVVDQENTEAYDANKIVDLENTEAYGSNKIVDQENTEAYDSNKIVDQENTEAYDSNKVVDQENTEAYDANKIVDQENTEAHGSNKIVDQENTEAYDSNKIFDQENTEVYDSNKIFDQENTEAYDSNKIVDQENTKEGLKKTTENEPNTETTNKGVIQVDELSKEHSLGITSTGLMISKVSSNKKILENQPKDESCNNKEKLSKSIADRSLTSLTLLNPTDSKNPSLSLGSRFKGNNVVAFKSKTAECKSVSLVEKKKCAKVGRIDKLWDRVSKELAVTTTTTTDSFNQNKFLIPHTLPKNLGNIFITESHVEINVISETKKGTIESFNMCVSEQTSQEDPSEDDCILLPDPPYDTVDLTSPRNNDVKDDDDQVVSIDTDDDDQVISIDTDDDDDDADNDDDLDDDDDDDDDNDDVYDDDNDDVDDDDNDDVDDDDDDDDDNDDDDDDDNNNDNDDDCIIIEDSSNCI